MSRRYDCTEAEERELGLAAAVAAVHRGALVVLPTDTVYGVGADAFTPDAVDALLAAKGRGRDMPSPVLVGSVRTLDGLVGNLPRAARELVEACWPGPLTIVLRHVPTLAWDLGETRGTVALRMPLHPLTLDLLAQTGPLAVSSANRSGRPPAMSCVDAEDQLGDSVAVYLDAGDCADDVPSSIVDVTGAIPRLLRVGALGFDLLREVVPDLERA